MKIYFWEKPGINFMENLINSDYRYPLKGAVSLVGLLFILITALSFNIRGGLNERHT